jgi:hypothetical protein
LQARELGVARRAHFVLVFGDAVETCRDEINRALPVAIEFAQLRGAHQARQVVGSQVEQTLGVALGIVVASECELGIDQKRPGIDVIGKACVERDGACERRLIFATREQQCHGRALRAVVIRRLREGRAQKGLGRFEVCVVTAGAMLRERGVGARDYILDGIVDGDVGRLHAQGEQQEACVQDQREGVLHRRFRVAVQDECPNEFGPAEMAAPGVCRRSHHDLPQGAQAAPLPAVQPASPGSMCRRSRPEGASAR